MKIIKNIAVALMLMSSLVFAKSVGTITALKGSASITRDGAEMEAKLGTKLEEKDTLKTKEKSQAQIIFDDETVITVGNNTSFSINEYLFEESKAPSAKFGLVNGAMRTITGKIGKIAPDKFNVQTKTATIGIRGTHFTVIAEADGNSKVYCTFGAISVSSNSQQTTVTQGFYVSVAPSGAKSEPAKFTPAELDKAISKSFEASKESQEKSSNSSQESQEKSSSSSSEAQSAASTASNETQSTASNSSQVTPTIITANSIPSMDVITQIETTRVENINLALADITSQTTTNTQATMVDVVEEIVNEEPTPTPTQPEPTPMEPTPTEPEQPTTPTEPTPTEPEQPTTPTEPNSGTGGGGGTPPPTEPTVTFTASGKTVAYRNNNAGYEQLYYNLPTVSSSANITATSTSGFDTDSYIKITDYVDGSTWTFTPASTLAGSIADGAFSGTFASIASTNTNISNIVIATSAFSITNDDLSNSDLMSWGEWNTEFTYTESSTAASAKFRGLWVGGESVTPENIIQSYTSTTPVVYDGVYKALLFSETAIATTGTGTATLSVDFGNDRASLTVGNLATFADMPISGNSFASPASHATANGTFYGAEGKEAAGSFSIMTEQYVPVAEGVYQVKTTQTPQ